VLRPPAGAVISVSRKATSADDVAGLFQRRQDDISQVDFSLRSNGRLCSLYHITASGNVVSLLEAYEELSPCFARRRGASLSR
jgi:hypothetical protein